MIDTFREVRRVPDMGDVPTIEEGIIYLHGDLEFDPWVASFRCPCGYPNEYNSGLIQLILLKDNKGGPRWEYELHEDGTITFTPSILRLMYCKCHFFIRRNKVVWA